MKSRLGKMILLRKYSSYKPKKLDYLFHCSRKKRVILFSNPKSAGSTLKRLVQLLEMDGDRSKIPENVHDKKNSPLCGILDLEDSLHDILVSDKYFRFCFVRNPYTRILSCYLDKICGERRSRYLSKLGVADRDSLTLEEFLHLLRNRRNLLRNPHWAPQSYLICPDRIRYSFIGRFEHLERHLEALTRRLGCEHFIKEMETISVRNHGTGAGDRVKQYIGPTEARLIREIYDRDFTFFAYPRDLELCHV